MFTATEKNCESIVCPPQLNEQDCGTGMYFEQGPSYYDDCCPLGGRCVCNISMCTGEPECADNSKAVLVMPSDEDSGKCCDMYKCQEGSKVIFLINIIIWGVDCLARK